MRMFGGCLLVGDLEAAAVVECLLARVRAGVMSEEQLQSELEAGGVPVPRQWRGQIGVR